MKVKKPNQYTELITVPAEEPKELYYCIIKCYSCSLFIGALNFVIIGPFKVFACLRHVPFFFFSFCSYKMSFPHSTIQKTHSGSLWVIIIIHNAVIKPENHLKQMKKIQRFMFHIFKRIIIIHQIHF